MTSLASVGKASTFVRGTPVRHTAARASARRAPARVLSPVRAKYGDESQFFDLDDLENTVGSWDLYGQEDEKRYPGIQAEFFQRAAAPLARREALYSFLAITFSAGVLLWGAKGSKDVSLPINVGPQNPPVVGPRGRI